MKSKSIKIILLIYIFCFWFCIWAKPDYGYEAVKELLNKYTRPITVLEVCVDSVHYSFDIANEYDSTCMVMYLGNVTQPQQYDLENKFNNLVIVNPKNVSHKMLEVLIRCEHFDVVLIHGVPAMLKENHILKTDWKKTAELLLKFGDFTFINLNGATSKFIKHIQQWSGKLISNDKIQLYKFETPKNGLDIARWNFKNLPIEKEPRYPIKSTFDEKFYFKDFCQNGIPWLKGINLLTFIMLRGICPSDETIKKNIKAMKDYKHNDLIIGNMVIQGNKVIAIDLDDPRWNGNQPKLIETALEVFGSDNFRLKEPLECMQRYRNLLSKKKL